MRTYFNIISIYWSDTSLRSALYNDWPRGFKTFFMLISSTKFQLLISTKIPTKKFLALSLSDVVFIMLINVKMPTIVGVLTFMSKINFVPSGVEYEKSFITLGPGLAST